MRRMLKSSWPVRTPIIFHAAKGAARTGQMLNYSEMARDVGVSSPTAERWLCVLAASGIVYLFAAVL